MARRRLLDSCHRLTLSVVAALACSATLASPVASAAEKGLSVDLTWAISDADKSRTQAAVADLGARWVRLTINWKDAEPTAKGSYNAWWLAEYDKALSAALAAGARPIVVISGTPGWANGGRADNVPPTRSSDYADFLRFITARLGDRVDAWQIWNEPNTTRFWTGNVSNYVELLKVAYPAAKAGDPTSPVLFGGLSLSDWPWVRDAYAAGAKGSFDAMAVHPYTYCGSTGPDDVRTSNGRITRDSFTGYREVYAEMTAAGDGAKNIWVTEFGWNTSTKPCDPGAGYWSGGVSEDQQAKNISRAYEIFAQDAYVPVAVLYSARNNYWTADADDGEARFGLMHTNYTAKPGYAAYKNITQVTSTPPPSTPPATPPANVPPTVTLTAPAPASSFGEQVIVSADASDSDGQIARVEFLVNGEVIGSTNTAPYQMTWTPSAATCYCAQSFQARATDDKGAVTLSSASTANHVNTAPSLTLAAPLAGATFRTTLSFKADARDDRAVSKVVFQFDGRVVKTVKTAPFTYDYVVPTSTTVGAHTAKATAYDAAGLSTVREAVVNRTG